MKILYKLGYVHYTYCLSLRRRAKHKAHNGCRNNEDTVFS